MIDNASKNDNDNSSNNDNIIITIFVCMSICG